MTGKQSRNWSSDFKLVDNIFSEKSMGIKKSQNMSWLRGNSINMFIFRDFTPIPKVGTYKYPM
jgi:hypothetical protein